MSAIAGVGVVVVGCVPDDDVCALDVNRDLVVTAPGVDFHVRTGVGDDVGDLDVDAKDGLLRLIADDEDGAHVDLDIDTNAAGPAAVPEDVAFTFDVEGDGGGVATSGRFDFDTLDADDVVARFSVVIDGAAVDGTVRYTSRAAIVDADADACVYRR